MPALPAFSQSQFEEAQVLLAAHVTYMMGRKLEEADWSDVYCGAKGIPQQGWSNLNLDVVYEGLGLELKMLSRPRGIPITRDCGTTLMHPSLTRAVRIASLDRDPMEVMREVFAQYALKIEQRREAVLKVSAGRDPDLRIGWFLWEGALRQFMYFEERMKAPDISNYRAVWNERGGSGQRLGSKNLWVYDENDKKRYSITTQAGIKIQPYFDVPAQGSENLYVFTVQGEERDGVILVWVTRETARELEALLGSLAADVISDAIESADLTVGVAGVVHERDAVTQLRLRPAAYQKLTTEFEGASDELRMRAFVANLQGTAAPPGGR